MNQKPRKTSNRRTRKAAGFADDGERYRVFIEDVADGFYETNLKGDFIFFNQAFARIYGCTREELQNHNYREFMTAANADFAYKSFNKVYRTAKGFTDICWEINRKDGEIRIMQISANLILSETGERIGFRGIARDVTLEQQAARTNQALFRIAKALPRYRRMNQLLEFITREVQDLIGIEGAMVILIDDEKQEFYFPVATFNDEETGRKFKEVRYPLTRGVAGEVYRTKKPIIVPDYYKSPYAYGPVDSHAGYQTRNMLDVPIQLQDRMIGVLCAVNKKDRDFNETDALLMSTIASTIALPIENAGIHEKLKRSYEEVKSLNRAKDRVINHLSHELKTPLSVLAASLSILSKKLAARGDHDAGLERVLERAQRNLKRILEMQYQVEDILREKDLKAYTMLSALLEVCSDELETLMTEEGIDTAGIEKIRERIERFFGPQNLAPQKIELGTFVRKQLKRLRPKFSHRQCRLKTRIEATAPILIPQEVLQKTLEGLLRNAVENTPDGGLIELYVRSGKKGPELVIRDYGIGITEENQRLLFESTLTTTETLNYSTKKPYDFYAGGKGFDLLRMKIFSERYHFSISMESNRCRFIPNDRDLCPGAVSACDYCRTEADCHNSGGTTVTLRFSPAQKTVSASIKGRVKKQPIQ